MFLLVFYRTTKTGTLPNLSFVMRKPEPLGTEFKTIVDGLSGIMLWLEVQEGKDRMAKLAHTKELGGDSSMCGEGS